VKREPSGAPTAARGRAKDGRGDDRMSTKRRTPKRDTTAKPAVEAKRAEVEQSDDETRRYIAEGIVFECPRLPGDKAEFPRVESIEETGRDALHSLQAAVEMRQWIEQNGYQWAESSRNIYMAAALEKGIEWLVARAAGKGEAAEDAQARLMTVARYLCGWLVSGYHAEWPGAVKLARKWADVPGFISLDAKVHEASQAMLRRMQQGEEVPELIRRPAPGKKRSCGPLDSSAPVHRLVATLHDYADTYRRHPFRRHAAFSPHKLVNDLCNLPPLSAITWPRWHKVTWAVLNHFTKGNPTTHPAFAREPLLHLTRAKTDLVQKVGEGWKARASRMTSEIP